MDPRIQNYYNNVYSSQQVPKTESTYFDLYQKSGNFACIKFISECCTKLEVRPSTFAYAATIFHRVIKNLLKTDYDKFTIATGSIYLATKVNEDPIRLKDVINVSQVTLDKTATLNELGNDAWILSIRDTIVQCELFIMRVLHFDPSVKLPHPYMFFYLNTLENWLEDKAISETPLATCAMSLLHDFYSNSTIIDFRPEHIAAACVLLAFQIYGIKLPGMDDTDSWFKAFCPNMSIDHAWEIIDQILKVYETESELKI